MLNLLLGLPRHIWLSPLDISQTPPFPTNDIRYMRAPTDSKMNALQPPAPVSLHKSPNSPLETGSPSDGSKTEGSQQGRSSSTDLSHPSSSSSIDGSPNSSESYQMLSSFINSGCRVPPPPPPPVTSGGGSGASSLGSLPSSSFGLMMPQPLTNAGVNAQVSAAAMGGGGGGSGKYATGGSGGGGGGKYQCKLCPQVFLHKSAMQLHAKEVHRGELKPHQCAQCMKSFSSHHQLSQHTRVHTGEKPYKCTFCEKCFKQLSHLQQHVRLHTGERPYKCSQPDCGRSFIQLANLQQHLRNHATQLENAKSRPFRCEICGKGFVAEVSLLTHTTTQHATLIGGQTLHSCPVCRKMFPSNQTMMDHMRMMH